MPLTRSATTLADVPALLVSHGPPATAAERGTVLFFHGFGASKETHLEDLEALAERGMLAVGLDNLGHGDRPPTPEQMKLVARLGWQGAFIEAVRRTADEVPSLLDALAKEFGARKFGAAGVSMGGYITYAAVLRDRRLSVAVPILGSPDWGGAEGSPHRQASLFFPVALLSQNAGLDTTVSPKPARAFHAELKAHYAHAPERLAHLEYPRSGHFMRTEDWLAARKAGLEWFERFLVAAPER